jgi:hypothetical protein
VVGVEQWAELRREHFVRGVSIKELSRRTGLSRNTVRLALRSAQPPRYSRVSGGSKLDPFRVEIQRLLREDPKLPGVRIGELLEPLGWDGGKTILDDYLREVRPLFEATRTTQRTIYRPGEICQFDVLLQPTLRTGFAPKTSSSTRTLPRSTRCSWPSAGSRPSGCLATDTPRLRGRPRGILVGMRRGLAPADGDQLSFIRQLDGYRVELIEVGSR